MTPFGITRSSVGRDHALITPESFVSAPLPGWLGTQGTVLISPRLGARFAQYFARLEPDGTSGPPAPGVERFVYVLEGEVALRQGRAERARLGVGGYAYFRAGVVHELEATAPTRLVVFEKPQAAGAGQEAPGMVVGHESDIDGAPFMGDPRAVLKVLLPDEPAFDVAVNLFTFQPGAALPLVEVHVMEHGLLMLQGQGVYRLGERWYPVGAGDVIWMAPYCPQWFVAMGNEPARYLYYKNVNRDPLAADGL